jgi:hypothetical protein
MDAGMRVLAEDQDGLPAISKRRSKDELVPEFWNEIGFPTPASRF